MRWFSVEVQKLFICLIILAVSMGGGWTTSKIQKASAATFGDWVYSVDGDGTATITGYSGNELVVDIPRVLDTYEVTHIGREVFKNKQLTSVTIPDSVTHIGSNAFYKNQLTSVTIPNSVTSIGSNAFADNRLTSVVIPESVTVIDYLAFSYNKLTSITIPSNVTSIGTMAFMTNELENVIFEGRSIAIVSDWFLDNDKLVKISGYENAEQFVASNNSEPNTPIKLIYEKMISIRFNPDGAAWSNAQTTELTGTSYIPAVKSYKWTKTTVEPDANDWTPFDGTVQILTPLDAGTWYLHVQTVESNGNKTFYHSNAFNIERTPPVIQLSVTSTAPTNQPVSITTDVSDEDSGVALQKWAEGNRDNSYFVAAGTAFSGNSFSVAENGTYTVYVEDAAGNESIETITVSNISTVGPTIQWTINSSEPTRENVSVTADVYAQNGIDLVKYALGKQDSSYFAAAGTPLVIVNGTAGIVVVDNGWMTIYAKDQSGNETVKQVEITSIDRNKPTITLVGNSLIEINSGTGFIDPGVRASDEYDGDVTSQVVRSGDPIDANKPGVYTIHYDVTDRAGNAAERVSRTVKIIESRPSNGGTTPSPAPSTPSSTTTPTPPTSAPPTTSTPVPTSKPFYNEKVNIDVIKALVEEANSVPAITFKDVPVNAPNAKAIELATKLGIIKGYKDGSFHANATVTRAEFATMLVKALGLTSEGNTNFRDTNGHWAGEAIATLKASGIINGYLDGTFRPNQSISRAEIVAMLSKVLNTNLEKNAKFTDVSGNWAEAEIDTLSDMGIVKGGTDGSFKPNAKASRAESLLIILRMLNISLGSTLDIE
ncbi:S-layer homology domain-containing protein [Paenibacillus amylolyticus]|uniref:Cell surface protein n=1 Tax=Paenibacillus amylolyticus TaxID=1451 RepID=A0A100VJ39_PAEAM|nr:S-layer homology domain-containing protein [Paenibacillus amylolyticus]GAS80741.1 cell surface protein [Paenibacillus amylolyticus]